MSMLHYQLIMFSIHPIKLWRYVSLRRLVVPSRLRRFFYTSWEDTLWDLLQYFQIPEKAICLVPEFYCMDVVKNMEEHGLACVFYPVDPQLQIDPKTFVRYVRKYQPGVVIILHSLGITNPLFSHNKSWLKYLPTNTLLIEDCVHRLIDPQLICLLTSRHFVIDSLRKVAPIYGSNLYGNATTLHKFKQSAWWQTLPYQAKVFWQWWLFQSCLHAAGFLERSMWSRWWNIKAKKFMQKGYDLIGDSQRAATGPWFFNFLSQFLSIKTIEEIKKQQVNCYQGLLQSCWANDILYQIHFDQVDGGKLRGFPVGIAAKNADRYLPQLQKNQLAWKYELDDCPWSKRQKIIYLPLGPHIELKEIELICKLLITTLNIQTL